MSRQKGNGRMGLLRYRNPLPTTGGRCLHSKYEPTQGPREMTRRAAQPLVFSPPVVRRGRPLPPYVPAPTVNHYWRDASGAIRLKEPKVRGKALVKAAKRLRQARRAA